MHFRVVYTLPPLCSPSSCFVVYTSAVCVWAFRDLLIPLSFLPQEEDLWVAEHNQIMKNLVCLLFSEAQIGE